MGRACGRHGNNAYTILVGNIEKKRPLRRHRHRWEDNIKVDLRKIGCGGMDWSHLAQEATSEGLL
jgi:hypothetical protein